MKSPDLTEILLEQANTMFNPNIEEVSVAGSTAPVFAIQWALANKVEDLAQLHTRLKMIIWLFRTPWRPCDFHVL